MLVKHFDKKKQKNFKEITFKIQSKHQKSVDLQKKEINKLSKRSLNKQT
jgi:hypothetical protein